MKENKKKLIKLLSKEDLNGSGFDLKILTLALQKIDSDSFDFDGEAVYTNDHKRIIYCLSKKESFTIPEGTEIIGNMAFRRKKNLHEVEIPQSIVSIGHDAFYDCDSLDNIVVPAGVKVVRGYAFADCDSLKKISFKGVPEHLSRHAFEDSDDLRQISVPKDSANFFQKALHYDPDGCDYLIEETDESGE